MKFLDILYNYSKTQSQNIAVCLNHEDYLLTYKKLWNDSGKVYRYLKSKHIGKEDFVSINMPRDPRTYVYVIGVMRAGAAFIVAESTYPLSRIEFIKKILMQNLF